MISVRKMLLRRYGITVRHVYSHTLTTFTKLATYFAECITDDVLLSDVISKRITFSQPFPPPSDQPANAP